MSAAQAVLIRALLIGCGGFAGAILRFGLATVVQPKSDAGAFPLGTLVVNFVGCFLAGVFTGIVDARPTVSLELRMFVLVGLLGGFTTFSAFGNEAFAMLRNGDHGRALLHVGAHVLGGIACVWLGFVLASR